MSEPGRKKHNHSVRNTKICCFLIGIVLLGAALSLVNYNLREDRESGEQAQNLLLAIQEQMPEEYIEETQEKQYDLFADYTETTEQEEPVIEIDGQYYIGTITIPELGIALPVMQEWSYPNLKIAPCRYQGRAFDNNLILLAHNYRSHFGRISELYSGSEIIFTDAAGKPYRYQVDNIETIAGTDVESMEFGSAENWDLTLFTCTLSGQSRVTVRASLIPEEED